MRINIITLGCSKNVVDSEHIAGRLAHAGHQVVFDSTRTDWDVCIVNTCGFIGDAKEESVDSLLAQVEVKRRGRRPRKVIAVGCLIERYRKELQAEVPEIDAFYGVHEWDTLVDDLIHTAIDDVSQPVIGCMYPVDRLQSTPRHYAYLKISEGCNRRCSFCAIPFIRGPHVSRPMDELIAEAHRMVADGVREIIVIAQDTTYYGVDLYGERRIGELLNRLAVEVKPQWIRLHYTYPSSFPDDAIHAIAAHPNICKYIDIPLQHINTRLLRAMHRDIDRDGTLQLLDKFRREIPNVSIRTTFIVGYPGETQAEYEELKEFVRQARFDRMGVFPFSSEEGTVAGGMPDDVPADEKQRRVDELMAIQEQISLEKNESRVGQTLPVLIDRKEGDYWIGRTEYDSPEVDDEVLVESRRPLHMGDFYNVTITSAMENDLVGQVSS